MHVHEWQKALKCTESYLLCVDRDACERTSNPGNLLE